MTKLATSLNKLITPKPVVRDQFWWSHIIEVTKLNPMAGAYLSNLLPDGTIVREVQIQAMPMADHWTCEAYMYLRILRAVGLSNSQIVDEEPLIRWRHPTKGWLWSANGRYINERWPCHITLRGANLHLGWWAQALDDNGIWLRVSVLLENP